MMRFVPPLAALLAALVALPAGAYQHLSQRTAVSGVSPSHWLSLPVAVTLDGGRPELQGEVDTALQTWNDVATARDPFPAHATLAADDFTAANLGTKWGDLSGDGRQEVVVDDEPGGPAIRALGFAPEAVNGYGPRRELVQNGQAVIDDMFLIINGTKHDFDRPSTEVHELGHTLGLAHTTAGFSAEKDGALSPVLLSQVPTMHPFSVPGTDRQSLEADDKAAISELYPEPSFATTTGTIQGRIVRCGSELPVLGANVRAVNESSPGTQLTRMTGFDGGIEGTYVIHGVPPGNYFVLVEPLAGDDELVDRLSIFSQVETDFTQEYFTPSKEADCAQDDDPSAREHIVVAAGATETADIKVDSATLALVIDVTGSMGPEIGAIKTGLEAMITGLEAAGAQFPRTAIVTFDDHATINTVSRDPARLRQVIAGLTTHSTPDCPEGSNAALMTAGRLLGSGGRAVLVTDAESHPTGPSRQAVDALYAAKGARLSVLLSGSCTPGSPARAAAAPAVAPPELTGGAAPEAVRPADSLGDEKSVRTFSEESLLSGGIFSFQPEVKTGPKTRYANTLANLGISAVVPAVAALSPATVPQGTALDVELTGSNTGFRSGSTVAVAGGGVTAGAVDVVSPTRLVAHLTAASDAALEFRDVTVSTPRGDGSVETATGLGALEVTAPTAGPVLLSVTPSTVAAGETRDVTISGARTGFGAGSTATVSGAGVTVNSLHATSLTTAVANVSVTAGATIAFRDLTVRTGGETAALTRALLVTAPPPPLPRLTAAGPASGARGTTVGVTLTGAGTAFADGVSIAAVSGTGVHVLSTSVGSPTSVLALLRIAADAPLGFRDLKVATGAHSATLADGFAVTPAVVTPAATPTATPTAAPPPPGGPAPALCTDRTRPRATFASAQAKRGRLTVTGRATDAGCAGSAVARVELAISRTAGRKCRFVGARKPRPCGKPVWLKAKGTARWSLKVKLPRGTYTLLLRARDRAGNLTAKPARRKLRVR